MSRKYERLSQPSLAQYFDAPDNYVGHFGWLCGYSADADFLNDAAERFTRLTFAQRQKQGKIALAVLLDPRYPPILVTRVPSVAHLPIKSVSSLAFRLLHAKVSLLGFKHKEDSNKWCLRLIVSTGNWTRQTLQDSLDLAWYVEIESDELNSLDEEIVRCCADIKAADDLFCWLANLFDTRLLSATANSGFSETASAKKQLDAWIHLCTKNAKGMPRLFDNRKQSLMHQLPGKIRACSSGVTRNYLAMGSGFYEGASKGDAPIVPIKIVELLKDEELLTKKPEVDIYVNPMACQSIASSVKTLNNLGITVRKAGQPSDVFGDGKQDRGLHAKFLFSANYRDTSDSCSSAWVYLGSGNLTNPGFSNKMSISAGNLEAGVVFAPSGLLWSGREGGDKQQLVTNLLPIQWVDAIDSNCSQLKAGSDMEPRDQVYVAPPIAWLTWQQNDGLNELRTCEFASLDLHVLDAAGNACEKSENGFLWKDAQPRQVTVQWPDSAQCTREASIPVVDEHGRIAATALQPIDLDDALWQLADFPLPLDDDEDIPEDGDEEMNGGGTDLRLRNKSSESNSYPIRQMMGLIESIAAKQTAVDERDWALWCARLEQTMDQAKQSFAVSTFIDLGLNPLSPLRKTMFRPLFAETTDTLNGRMYEETLNRIEKLWKVDHLTRIGDEL
jgi:hypothetical protein